MSFIVDYDGVMVNSCLPLNRYGLQGDLALIDQLIQSINKEAEHVHINKQQIKNCKKRIGILYNVLRQLPNPRPTPQILCVIRSADFLIKNMRYDGVWEDLLCESFTCRDKFTALRERLRVVWNLHSSANWDSEDKEAESIDEEYAAQSFIELFHPTRGDLCLADQRIGTVPMPLRGVNTSNNNNNKIVADGVREDVKSIHPSPQHHGSHTDTKEGEAGEDDRTLATVPQVIEFHHHRSRSSWRLAFEELGWMPGGVHQVITPHHRTHTHTREPFAEELDPARASPSSPSSVMAATAGSHSSTHINMTGRIDSAVTSNSSPFVPRFSVWRGYTYRHHVVVLKELSGSVEGLLSAQTSANFVEDAVVRTRWCHPDLVTYYGAYTEKFASASMSPSVMGGGGGKGAAVSPVSSSSLTEVQANHPMYHDDAGVHRATRSSKAANASYRTRGQPHAALGLIMEDLTAVANVVQGGGVHYATEEEEDSIDDASNTRATTTATTTTANNPSTGSMSGSQVIVPRYHTLRNILFTRRHRFSVLDSIDITLQLADVLQYILLDADHVSLDVLTAWISVSPSNVYVAHMSPDVKPSPLLSSTSPPPPVPPSALTNTESAHSRTPSATVVSEGHSTMRSQHHHHPTHATTTACASAALPPILTEHKPITEVLMPHTSLIRSDENTPTLWLEYERCPSGGANSSHTDYTQTSHRCTTTNTAAMHHHHSLHHTSSSSVGGSSVNSSSSISYPHTPALAETQQAHANETNTTLGITNATASPPRHSQAGSSTTAAMNASLTTAFIPIITRGTYVIKYSPPCFIYNGPYNRWRPHPYAQSPVCYTLAQLLLALLTNTPPYAQCRTQRELRAAMGDCMAVGIRGGERCQTGAQLAGANMPRRGAAALFYEHGLNSSGGANHGNAVANYSSPVAAATHHIHHHQNHHHRSDSNSRRSTAAAASTSKSCSSAHTACVAKTGYNVLPATLPLCLQKFLHRALALQCPVSGSGAGGASSSSLSGSSSTSPMTKPMTLMDLREMLWNVRDAVRASGMTVLPLPEESHSVGPREHHSTATCDKSRSGGVSLRGGATPVRPSRRERSQTDEERSCEVAMSSSAAIMSMVDLDDYGEI